MCKVLKTLWMASVALASATTVAWGAAGVDLAWNHCRGQVGAATIRTSACTATTGHQGLYASFNPPSGISQLEGAEIYIDYSEFGGLSCWWNFSAGATRETALVPLAV